MSIDMMILVTLVAFFAAAFFAGSETAIIASQRIRLRHLADKGDRRARLVLQYRRNPEYFLSIVLVGTNLGMIGCTATFTGIMVTLFGDRGASIATLILVPTLLIFQEILPKAVFLYYSDRLAMLSVLPLRLFAVAMFPIIKSISSFSNLLARMFGVGRMDRKMTMTMQELLFHLQGSTEAGLISADTMELAERASEMTQFTAGDVMVALEDVVMAPAGLRRSEYREIFVRERFSRLPIFDGERGNVIGFLAIHSLLKARGADEYDVRLDPPYVVTARSPVVGMLGRMKDQGGHMAMVRGTGGSIVGMTTLEDILERLVGAITDEFH